jgi:hypothetical protein
MKNTDKTLDDLVKVVVDQIKEDINEEYVEAIEELLSFCPKQNLIHYLPEEVWEEYNHLIKED